jgi:hypothetical protein
MTAKPPVDRGVPMMNDDVGKRIDCNLARAERNINLIIVLTALNFLLVAYQLVRWWWR